MSVKLSAVVPRLTITDECDRCGATARLAMLVGDPFGNQVGAALLFCFHHANKWERAIFASAVAVVDGRGKFIQETINPDHESYEPSYQHF